MMGLTLGTNQTILQCMVHQAGFNGGSRGLHRGIDSGRGGLKRCPQIKHLNVANQEKD